MSPALRKQPGLWPSPAGGDDMNERICERCRRTNDRPRAAICWRCKKAHDNAKHRALLEIAGCRNCGTSFMRSPDGKKVYCSEDCHVAAKRDRYSGPRVPAVQFPPLAKPHDIARYKRTLRLDPCAYCGTQPCGGVDHIEPTGKTGDRSDWTNMIGCCKRCNETKRDLPLLLALPWIPVSRKYHDERRALFSAA